MPNYTLGRGEIHFAEFLPGTETPGAFRFFGNCSSFTLSRSEEKLDHYSSTSGLRKKDASVTLQIDTTGSITCDDVDPENIKLFFYGESETIVASALTSQTETFTTEKQGRSYQVGITDARPTGVRKLTNVVVTEGATTFDLTDDYLVDADRGIITVVEGGAIVSGTEMEVAYDTTASERIQVRSGDAQISGALQFRSFNPEGQRFDYFLPSVKVSPTGDLGLISDEWQEFQLDLEVLRKGGLAEVYLDGQPYLGS